MCIHRIDDRRQFCFHCYSRITFFLMIFYTFSPLNWTCEPSIRKMFLDTDLLQNFHPSLPLNRSDHRLSAYKRRCNMMFQKRCLEKLGFVVIVPLADGSHRMQGAIIAGEGYAISNDDLFLKSNEAVASDHCMTMPYSRIPMPLNSVLQETLAIKVACTDSLADHRLMSSMRADSENCATTNDIAEGHSFKDAVHNVLRQLLKQYGTRQLPILDTASYIKGRNVKASAELSRKTIIICVFYELMKSSAKTFMIKHLTTKLTTMDEHQKLVTYRQMVKWLCGKENSVISDVTVFRSTLLLMHFTYLFV